MAPTLPEQSPLAAAVRCEWSREEEQLTEPGAEFLQDFIISTTKVSLEASWEPAGTFLIMANKMVAVTWGSHMGKTDWCHGTGCLVSRFDTDQGYIAVDVVQTERASICFHVHSVKNH